MQHEDFIPLDDCKPFYVQENLIKGRVISVSPQEELRVGIIKGFSVHQNSGSKLPIVTFNDGVKDEDRLCFSLLIPYTKKMFEFLVGLSPKGRTEMVKNILHLNAELRRLERPDVLKDVK